PPATPGKEEEAGKRRGAETKVAERSAGERREAREGRIFLSGGVGISLLFCKFVGGVGCRKATLQFFLPESSNHTATMSHNDKTVH
ncbi:hypothetical protein, partial [Paramuribaculum intestinale]|uniref:hypothetical protein n=1 Tax=Paramuribaculum intestinale TaxID=2094151 RepID=UPI0025A9C856